jgi:hypothetical protein
MTRSHKTPDFVKGDLVYFVGYEDSADRTRLGVIYDIEHRHLLLSLYEIYWFKEKLSTTHTASHIGLVYTEDLIDSTLYPNSYYHLKDRVNDRSEGD